MMPTPSATRSGLLIILAGMALVATGATCFPLIDLGRPDIVEPDPPTPLAIAISRPASDREIPEGTSVSIVWTVSNTTGQDAIVDVIVRDRQELANTVIAGGLRVGGGGGSQTTMWDTSDFAGRRFDIIVKARAEDESAEATADGQITVNAAPSFEFTEPFEDVVLGEGFVPDPNTDSQDPTVTIRWSAGDPEATATAEIFADPDSDHESGNEVSLVQRTLPATADFDSFDWDGKNPDAPTDEDVTYTIFARVDDMVNPPQTIEGLATITVPVTIVKTFSLEFTSPDEDSTFLISDDPLRIDYTLDESDDVLIDLGIDTDDDHQNGNETLILFQRLISKDTHEDSFDWNGTDRDGNPVDDAIYRIYMVVNRGSGSPQVIDAGGLVFRRSDKDMPLIAMLEPTSDVTRNAGDFQTFKWRDDDPSENAVIRLTLDDDDQPDEAVETGMPEIEILADRDASGDGVQDTFAYQVPADLTPDTYFVFAYIDRDGAAPFDHVSVAPGRLTVEDPTQ